MPALRPYRAAAAGGLRRPGRLGAGPGPGWTAQRIHGDLHLGQALRAAGGELVLIDFEGEPARPLAERRRPQPPVQDVAGMLRSFDYAARTATRPHGRPTGRTAAGTRTARATPRSSGTDPRDQPVLMRAYETDKAVYEVLYEARHRPAWLPIPMAAIRPASAVRTRRSADGPTVPSRRRLRRDRRSVRSPPTAAADPVASPSAPLGRRQPP